MRKILPVIIIVFFSFTKAKAQLDPCITTDKKQKKSIEEINKVQDFDKASILLKESIRLYPDNAEL